MLIELERFRTYELISRLTTDKTKDVDIVEGRDLGSLLAAGVPQSPPT